MKSTVLKRVALSVGTLLTVSLLGLACTKTAQTKPQFIFKPAPDTSAAAKINGKVITMDELLNGVESELYEAQMKVHEIKMNRLRALVLKKFMEADPKFKGNNDDFLEKHIASKVTVSQKQIDAFVKERKIPKAQLNENLKAKIKEFLEREEKRKAIENWMAQKTQKSPVEVYFQEPSRPVFEIALGDAPIKGKPDAKVTVVEFSDFQCPFCAKGADILNELKKKYGNKIKIAFKNFPLPFHKEAKIAAEAAMCANEQGSDKFWKMHDSLFKNQSDLKKEGLLKQAKALKLDMTKFTACLDGGKYGQRVMADMEEGKKVGVKSTPAFFVNGQLINGAQPIEVFSELIDKELAK